LHSPPYLKDVAAQPRETMVFQNSHKFKNAILVFINKILLNLVKEANFFL